MEWSSECRSEPCSSSSPTSAHQHGPSLNASRLFPQKVSVPAGFFLKPGPLRATSYSLSLQSQFSVCTEIYPPPDSPNVSDRSLTTKFSRYVLLLRCRRHLLFTNGASLDFNLPVSVTMTTEASVTSDWRQFYRLSPSDCFQSRKSRCLTVVPDA